MIYLISDNYQDRGYAWVIFVCCTGLRLLLAGPDGIIGVLKLDLIDRFQSSETLVNTILTMQFGIAVSSGKTYIWGGA